MGDRLADHRHGDCTALQIDGDNKPSVQQTDFFRSRSLSPLGFRLFQLRTKDFGIDDCWWEESFSVAIPSLNECFRISWS